MPLLSARNTELFKVLIPHTSMLLRSFCTLAQYASMAALLPLCYATDTQHCLSWAASGEDDKRCYVRPARISDGELRHQSPQQSSPNTRLLCRGRSARRLCERLAGPTRFRGAGTQIYLLRRFRKLLPFQSDGPAAGQPAQHWQHAPVNPNGELNDTWCMCCRARRKSWIVCSIGKAGYSRDGSMSQLRAFSWRIPL